MRGLSGNFEERGRSRRNGERWGEDHTLPRHLLGKGSEVSRRDSIHFSPYGISSWLNELQGCTHFRSLLPFPPTCPLPFTATMAQSRGA